MAEQTATTGAEYYIANCISRTLNADCHLSRYSELVRRIARLVGVAAEYGILVAHHHAQALLKEAEDGKFRAPRGRS